MPRRGFLSLNQRFRQLFGLPPIRGGEFNEARQISTIIPIRVYALQLRELDERGDVVLETCEEEHNAIGKFAGGVADREDFRWC